MRAQADIGASLGGWIITRTTATAWPLGIVGASLAGRSLQDWVYLLTAAGIIVQTLYTLWRWIRDWRLDRRQSDA